MLLTPLGARAADLVVWWEKGFYVQEDEAVREIIAAFEQKTGKQVDLVQPTHDEMPAKAEEAVAAGHPPDFLFGFMGVRHIPRWAYEDRLVDLEDVVAPSRDLFDADLIEISTLLNGTIKLRPLTLAEPGGVIGELELKKIFVQGYGQGSSGRSAPTQNSGARAARRLIR
jgi:hypothetical protein